MDLPDELELPLASGASWWYWLGGRPALDFVNTQRERWCRNVETLVTPRDLGLWLQEARLLDGPTVVTGARLRGARRLRAAIDTGVQAAINRTAMPAEAMNEINRWLRYAPAQPRLTESAHGQLVLAPTAPGDPIRHAVAQIALDAAELLGSDQRDRLRVCASDSCSARFYDASRAANRRWCSMTACGNTAKARRHRARHATPTLAENERIPLRPEV